MLAVLNRELGADFDLDAFEHVAVWDDENLWVDIRLRSLARQVIEISALDMMRRLRPRARRCGPRSRPSSPATGLEGIYAEAGLELVEWWTDPEGLFALLARTSRASSARRQRLDQLAELSGVVTGVSTGSVIPPST